MASGIMTPPKRNENVIGESSSGKGSGAEMDELEAYLKKNAAPSSPKAEQASFKLAPSDQLPKSKDSSFSEKDKAGYFEQQPKEKVLVT